ncbi:hypothetical protein T440DRAFT_533795, partial [Plenodomus tracheiphilus IPT5]
MGDALFDFRSNHGTIRSVLDIGHHISRISISMRATDILGCETVVRCLEQLYKLYLGSSVNFVVETGGFKQNAARRGFRRTVSAFLNFSQHLAQAAYVVNIVMDPTFVRSNGRKGSGTTFNIIQDQNFRYVFRVKGLESTTNSIEEELDQV